MSHFSIVVPMMGAINRFEDTLASVLRYRPPQSQILVPHDGSYTDPHGLAGDVEFLAAGRSGRLIDFWNESLAHASGTYVCLFRPGTELDEGWDEFVMEAMADEAVAAVAPILDLSDSTARSGAKSIWGVTTDASGTRRLQRSRQLGLRASGPSSFAAVYRNDALGWLPQLDSDFADLFLDVDLMLGLHTLGFRCQVVDDWHVNAEPEAILSEASLPHGCSASRALLRHGDQFERRLPSLLVDGLSAMGGQAWRIPHALGRLAAGRHAKSDRKSQSQLARNQKTRRELISKREATVSRTAQRRAA